MRFSKPWTTFAPNFQGLEEIERMRPATGSADLVVRSDVQQDDLLFGHTEDEHDPVAVGEADGMFSPVLALQCVPAQARGARILFKLLQDSFKLALQVGRPSRELPGRPQKRFGPEKVVRRHRSVAFADFAHQLGGCPSPDPARLQVRIRRRQSCIRKVAEQLLIVGFRQDYVLGPAFLDDVDGALARDIVHG